ncbi:MAG: hypothetical protein DRI40_01635 [Chloroflexi bacterium]|nr:MAG: hypothetical protein DRI40_01635 [Chloroflexota bacterium]
MTRRTTERGQALALVLIALAMGTTLIVPTLSYMATGLRAQQINEDYLAGLESADAGLLDAIWRILSQAVLQEVNEEGSYAYDFELGWKRWPVTIEVPSIGGSEWQTIKNNNQCKIDVEPNWVGAELTEDMTFYYVVRLRMVHWDVVEFCFELPTGLVYVSNSVRTAGPESISTIDPDAEVDAPDSKYWRTKSPAGWTDMISGAFLEYEQRPSTIVPGVKYLIKEWLMPDKPWTEMNSGTSNDLNGIWGSAPSGIPVAVGDAGTLLRYTNNSWNQVDSGTTETLCDISGSCDTDVFAVGHEGTILHYDGTGWQSMESGTTVDLRSVWACSSSCVFAAGPGTVLHYDGTSWSPLGDVTGDLYGVWARAYNDVFAVGRDGAIIHYNGVSWRSMDSGTTNDLYDIWGTTGNRVFAVGSEGTVLQFDRGVWSAMDSGTTEQLTGIWGRDSGDILAVGNAGTIIHYDGSAWTELTSGATEDLRDIWADSDTDIYAVGIDGTILHYHRVQKLTWIPEFGATGNDTFIMVLQAKGMPSWGLHYVYPVFGDGVSVYPLEPTAALASAMYNILIDYGGQTISAVIAITAEGIKLISYTVIE